MPDDVRAEPPHDEPGAPRGRSARLGDAGLAQHGRCLWCDRAFGPLVTMTRDHVVPRVKGGPSWRENEVAVCGRCNAERGHQSPVAWLEECRRRGWEPQAAALAAVLDALTAAVAERGGQRRARPYLVAQRRRLARLGETEGGRGPGVVPRDHG